MKLKKPKRWTEIIARLAKNGTLVEVGTWKGDSAFKVLDARPDIKAILVDPWRSGLVDDGLIEDAWIKSGSKMAQRAQDEVEAIYRKVEERSKTYGDRCRILRMTSVEAAKVVNDTWIDMVFIDANHSYESVKSDIEAWTPLVRVGRIIGGHDYDHPRYPGVKRAVVEAFGTPITGIDRTWWYQL